MWQKQCVIRPQGCLCTRHFVQATYNRSWRQLGFAGCPSSRQRMQLSLGSSLACRAHGAVMSLLRPICLTQTPSSFPLIAQLLLPRYCPEHQATLFLSPCPFFCLCALAVPITVRWDVWRSQGVDWVQQDAWGWWTAHTLDSNLVASTKNV